MTPIYLTIVFCGIVAIILAFALWNYLSELSIKKQNMCDHCHFVSTGGDRCEDCTFKPRKNLYVHVGDWRIGTTYESYM